MLVWAGAPLPLFRPSRSDVRNMRERLTNGSRIMVALDARERPMHCHHEKTIVIDDRVAFVGGIDLTSEDGDRFDSSHHLARDGLRVARRGNANRRSGGRRRRRPLRDALARVTAELAPCRPCRIRRHVDVQIVRTVPEKIYDAFRMATSGSSSPTFGPFAGRGNSSTSKTSFSGHPRSLPTSPTSSRIPRPRTSDCLFCFPPKPNNGADDTRGILGELIEADAARAGYSPRRFMRAQAPCGPHYVHAKVRSSTTLGDPGIGQPQRALAVQRHRDEPRQPRPVLAARHAFPALGGTSGVAG